MQTSRIPALLLVLALVQVASANPPDPLRGHVDESLFPQGYGVLASESMMYPIDQSAWPVKIARSRQLFVDNFLITSMQDLSRVVNPVTKHPENPVVDRNRPWEGLGPHWEHVHRDNETGKFRMWYSTWLNYTLPSGKVVRSPACYAESDDGVHWTKPELGLCEFEGSTANNIVILEGGLAGLLYEPDDPDPERQYKGIVWHDWHNTDGDVPPEGYYLYTSPDGIHWKQARERTLLWNQNKHQAGIGDTSQFRWDPRLKKYICDTKVLFRRQGTMRCRGMMESDDLVHWSRPRMTIYPDALDGPEAQIYGHHGWVYESMWVGMVRVMRNTYVPGSLKQTTIELTASRDGRHWTRVGRREQFIPLGPPDSWEPHYHDPFSSPLLVGDELWFYYRSTPLFDPKIDAEKAERKKVARLGLATLRRDGFVSLDAGKKPGQIVTRPLTFEMGRLHVNAQVHEGGYVRAEVRNADGNVIGPLALGNCTKLTGDQLDAVISWGGDSTLSCPEGESLRIAFELQNAKLYSFWID